MTPLIRSTGSCLLAAVIVVRLTSSCLIREAMAFVPNGSPSLFTNIFLSNYSSTSFIRNSYLEFSKLLKKLGRWNGDDCTLHKRWTCMAYPPWFHKECIGCHLSPKVQPSHTLYTISEGLQVHSWTCGQSGSTYELPSFAKRFIISIVIIEVHCLLLEKGLQPLHLVSQSVTKKAHLLIVRFIMW
jgi:hypothetical protein